MNGLLQIRNLPATVAELERLLATRLVDGRISVLGPEIYLTGKLRRKIPVSEFVGLVIEHHNSGNAEFATLGLCRLAVLIMDLQTIEANDSHLLNHFRRVFKKGTGNTYWGWRFEVDVAATLFSKAVPFTKGEFLHGGDAANADFQLDDLSIECSSCHAEATKFTTYFSKIAQAITDKGKRPYCSRTCALFIDVTNLLQHRLSLGLPADGEGFRKIIREAMTGTGFGAVVLSSWIVNKDVVPWGYQNLLTREDHPEIHPRLEEFLSRQLSLDGNIRLTRFKPIGSY